MRCGCVSVQTLGPLEPKLFVNINCIILRLFVDFRRGPWIAPTLKKVLLAKLKLGHCKLFVIKGLG